MSPADLVADFFASTRNLKQAEIDWLLKEGVPNRALAFDHADTGYVLGIADVHFDGELFDFAEGDTSNSVTALVVVARGRDGVPVDLVAWSNKTQRIGAFYGRAALLGEQALHAPRILDAPTLHRDPLDWLRAGRDGCVIVRPSRAGRALLDAPGRLAVVDEVHARELATLLSTTVDLARIVIPIRKAA